MSVPGDRARATTPAEITYHVPADLAVVREFVRAEAIGLGLSELSADLLTLAVSELATNTLQHTTGGGRVSVWAEPGRVRCEVADQGPPRALGRPMPAAEAPRGRGLPIVERICDDVEIISGPNGTCVRLGMLL